MKTKPSKTERIDVWQKHNYISLGGLSDRALARFLSEYSNIKHRISVWITTEMRRAKMAYPKKIMARSRQNSSAMMIRRVGMKHKYHALN
jgi:hypothetical protein